MSTLKVGAIRGVSASSDAITVANDGSCTAKITNNLSNRNKVINGAMQVAQRGTTSGTEGYSTIDRFSLGQGSCDEVPTQSQVDVASGTTPYTSGFRKAFKITNGNQTSGAQAANFIKLTHGIEAQDIANSVWNYTSSSSFITLSFWVKSSVAQNFFGRLRAHDGTSQNYPFETGSLSADTWTKVTKTIPGNSNLTFDNDNGMGLELEWTPYRGGNTTDPGVTLNAWAAFASGTRTPDQTSTWFTTNDATFEITGIQLEVGEHATDFEHRSFSKELALCQRYFEIAQGEWYGPVYATDSTIRFSVPFKVTKRADPTLATISTDENCCSSVSVTGGNYDATLGARVQGNNVFLDGANRHFSAKFSASSEL